MAGEWIVVFGKCVGYNSDDVAGDGRLEMSKRKYDSAKHRVAKLHKEFDELKQQLEGQVKSLDHARGDLVTQIKTAEGLPVAAADDSAADDSSDNFADADIDFGSLLKNKHGKGTRKDARRFVYVRVEPELYGMCVFHLNACSYHNSYRHPFNLHVSLYLCVLLSCSVCWIGYTTLNFSLLRFSVACRSAPSILSFACPSSEGGGIVSNV